jgi:hypothetical protein
MTTTRPISGLHHAACTLAPSSFVRPLPGRHVDVPPDLLAQLWSGGTGTTGAHPRGHNNQFHGFPPNSKVSGLPWREHAYVNHTQKEYARGDVHENRAECLFSLLKPYLRVFRGISKANLPGYVGFFQFLRNFRHQNAFKQAEMILQAALDPAIASRARRGEFVTCFDYFDLLQTPIN